MVEGSPLVKIKPNILLPRVIYGNRGDILSRWGLINGLTAIGQDNFHAFAHKMTDLPPEARNKFTPYGKYHNLFLTKEARQKLKNADRILWSCGLDLTDESSLAKLLYLLVTFSHYHMLGKELYCVYQGAGPLKTRKGKKLTKRVLQRVTCFIARDKYSSELIHQINPQVPVTLAGDAIFFPGFEEQIEAYADTTQLDPYLAPEGKPLIAMNIRRWFHFSSDLIPFQLATKRYESRGLQEMDDLVGMYVDLVHKLRQQYDARILLISAYNPGVFSWEDDLPWLRRVKASFSDDQEVVLMDTDMDMMDYLLLMSKIDLAISMRLHSSLTVLRFGNPAVNISYSPKGVNVFRTLGLEDNAFEISNAMQNPTNIWLKVESILDDLTGARKKVVQGVGAIIQTNMNVLRSLFSGDDE